MIPLNENKLTIELVPKTSFFDNVRSHVTKEEWDVIRKKSYKRANYKCEICGENGIEQGFNHPIECHEIWKYDDNNYIQMLVGLISLCPECHKVKHAGLSQLNGEIDMVINKLMSVNNLTREEAVKYVDDSFDLWIKRSKHSWEVNISMLELYKK